MSSFFHIPAGVLVNPATGYSITNAVWFDGVSDYLTWTPGSAADSATTTSISCWVKLNGLTSRRGLCGYTAEGVEFYSDDKLKLWHDSGVALTTTQVFRDPTAFFHVLMVYDTTEATDTNRVKLYINGTQVTSYTAGTWPTLNDLHTQLCVNGQIQRVGQANGSIEGDMYLAEFITLDGIAASPYTFGEFVDGNWCPIDPSSVTTPTSLIAYGDCTFYGDGPSNAPTDGSTVFNGSTSLANGSNYYDEVVSVTYPGCDWGSGNTKSIDRVVMWSSSTYGFEGSGSGHEDHLMKFTLQGSDDGFTTFTELGSQPHHEVSGMTNESVAIIATDNTAYRYHRVKMEILDGTGQGLVFSEMQFFQNEDQNSFGTNGFWLDFKDSAVLGKDVSQGIDDSTTYRYFKLDITAVDGSTTWTGAEEFSLIADGVEYPTSNMTSNSAPSPLVASATGEAGSQPAWKAFDGLFGSANYWQYNSVSFPIFLKIDLGSGNGVAPQQMTLVAPETPDRTPYDFTLQGSNDDSAWTTLETYTGITGWSARESRTLGIQGNHFTSVSMTAAQQVSDAPTNDTADGAYGNFATLNPLDKFGGASTLSEGNLHIAGAAATAYNNVTASIANLTTGKWIWATKADAKDGGQCDMWITNETGKAARPNNPSGSSNYWLAYLLASGAGIRIHKEGTEVVITGTNTLIVGDYVLCAFDADTKKLWFGTYDVSTNTTEWADGATGVTGDPAAGTDPSVTMSGTEFSVGVSSYTGRGGDVDFGQSDLLENITIPTDFKFLNTANLPAPTIEDPSVHHFVDGSVSHNGTTGSFTLPGDPTVDDWLIIVKSRTATEKWWMFDAIRGYTKYISCDSTSGSTTDATTLSVADTGVVTMGAAFTSGTYVVEAHKAGATSGSGTSNSDGTITSTISVNTTSGFSIITYTGTGANATVGHGLTNLPECVWGKRTTDAESWMCHYVGMAGTGYFGLNATTAVASAAVVWNSTTPSSTVVSLGSNASINGSSKANVMYCWEPIEGYSKFGSYEGNGSTDGTYVHLGFSCGSWLTKTPDTTGNWYAYDTQRDPYNVAGAPLFINATTAEQTHGSSYYVDFTSNGLKARTAGDINGSRGYIYSAFADTTGTASSQTKAN